MFKMLTDDPYALMAVMGVVDVFGLIGFIIFTLKSTDKGDRLKKILIVSACMVALDVCVFSVFSSTHTFYDRNGNRYSSRDDLKYYDNDGVAYIVETNEKFKAYLVSEDGTQMYIADRIYIDKDGYIVYDRFNKFRQKNDHVFTDADGNEYYSLSSVKWKKNGQIGFSD